MARSAGKLSRLARRWAVRSVRRRLQPHGLVLMYHRVANSPLDPWKICVSPERFAAHMHVLKRMARVVPLLDLPDAINQGDRYKPVVSVTFDDGYVDNLEEAAPVLERSAIPATVFLATGWIGRNRPYWWDRLAWILLAPQRLPDTLELTVADTTIRWRDDCQNANAGTNKNARMRLHLQVWSDLRKRDEHTRDAALEQLAAWSGMDADTELAGRPMNPSELSQLIASGSIEIGAHTVTHAVLPELPLVQQQAEIRNSLNDCERLTGYRPSTFAYPYGDLDLDTVAITRLNGVRLACSTRSDLLWPGADTHTLPRVAVENWSGRDFERWLRWYWFP